MIEDKSVSKNNISTEETRKVLDAIDHLAYKIDNHYVDVGRKFLNVEKKILSLEEKLLSPEKKLLPINVILWFISACLVISIVLAIILIVN